VMAVAVALAATGACRASRQAAGRGAAVEQGACAWTATWDGMIQTEQGGWCCCSHLILSYRLNLI
jgi:hypothetical protein